MLPILLAVLIPLWIPTSQAGDPCPSKEELGTCTCSHIRLQNGMAVTTAAPNVQRVATMVVHKTPEEALSSLPSADARESSETSLYTEVVCKGARTITALEETVKFALHRKLVDKLSVSNVPGLLEHTLVRLPSGWLKNTRIRQFEIHDTILSGDFLWKGSPFEGQADTLLWLSAFQCSLCGALTFEDTGTVNTKGLNLLPRVEGVDFSLNHLSFVRATAFRNPPANLSTIILSRNSLQNIEAGSFQHVPLLKCVDLSHNLLESVIRTLFAAPAKLLEKINLSWNFLRALPADLFVNMPSLKVVNLSKNFLHSTPEKPWAAIWRQLTFLDLTGNYIDCDCNLLWLLPVLSPAKKNDTTTPQPTPLPGQTILGSCSQNRMPGFHSTVHTLTSLTRDRLMCR